MVIVIPAIDLKEGRVVRLSQGDFGRQEIMNDQPVETARYFKEQGAGELHVVDLDGARSGQPENREIIQEILKVEGLKIQIGGGIRNKAAAEKYLNSGAAAVVLGTAAVTGSELVRELIEDFGPERVVVSLDARRGELAISGWEEGSGRSLKEALAELKEIGVRRFVYTDITRDGMLSGPDLETLKFLLKEDIEVTASGGISSKEDLEYLEETGIERAIVGKALYLREIKPETLWQVNQDAN